MKRLQFGEITVHADNKMKYILANRNVTQYGGTDFCLVWDGNAPGDVEMHSSSDFTIASVVEDGTTTGNYIVVEDAVTRSFGDDIYGGIGDANDKLAQFQSLDGGSTWAVVEITITTDAGAHDSAPRVLDIIKVNGIVWWVVVYEDNTPDYFVGFVQYNTAGAVTYTGVEIKDPHSVYPGHYDSVTDAYTYYVLADADNKLYPEVFDGTANPTKGIEITGVTNPGTWMTWLQQYWKQGDYEWFTNRDYFLIRKVGDTTFTNYGSPALATSILAFVWRFNSSGYYEIAYMLFENSIYYLNEHGLPLYIQAFTDDAFAGFGDWISEGTDAVYQCSYVDYPFSLAQIVGEIQTSYKARLEVYEEPVERQWIILASDAEAAYGTYKIDKYSGVTNRWRLELSGGDDIDLKYDNDTSYTTTDAPDILIAEVATCSHLYNGGNISTTPATTYTKNFRGKDIANKFRWAGNQEGYLVHWTPNYDVYYDQYTASGITVLDADTISIDEPNYESIKASIVIVDGSANTTPAIAKGEPNFGTYYDEYMDINDQTELQGMADSILAKKNLKLRKIRMVIYGKGFILPGTSLTLTNTQYSVSAETVYCIYSKFDEVQQTCDVILTDAVYLPVLNKNTATNIKIQNNRQLISNTETTLASVTPIGATNAQYCYCPYSIAESVGKIRGNGAQLLNVDSSDLWLLFGVPLPKTAGSLKLYISGIRIDLMAANATNYLDTWWIYSANGAAQASQATDDNAGSKWKSAQIITDTFTAVDCSEFETVVARLFLYCTNASSVIVPDQIEVLYYYE